MGDKGKKIVNQAVVIIRKGASFEEILHHIADGARYVNGQLNTSDKEKKDYTGILRCPSSGWEHSCKMGNYALYTPYGFLGGNKYCIYSI